MEKENIELKKEEYSRYSRNLFLKEIGVAGQKKLKKSKVLVVGAGGLGGPLLYYLASSGVGNLSFVEYDIVDLTNLQRQILYDTQSLGKKKSEVAYNKLHALNPEIKIQTYSEKLNPENAFKIIENVDLVLDGSDNFYTRFLINDVCYFKKIPLISGGVLQFYGLILGILPTETPCYRCLIEAPPETEENCSTVGVLAPATGIIGSLMAVEAIKYLLGIKPNIMNFIIRVDLLNLNFRKTKLPKNENCKLCGKNPLYKTFNPNLVDYWEVCRQSLFSIF
ncbi:MAG: HesA/MoeB/ThiF family protein [Leptonema sp. (in: bacteria)]